MQLLIRKQFRWCVSVLYYVWVVCNCLITEVWRELSGEAETQLGLHGQNMWVVMEVTRSPLIILPSRCLFVSISKAHWGDWGKVQTCTLTYTHTRACTTSTFLGLSRLSDWDLWSKTSTAVMPFSVYWHMSQLALWAPVGMTTDQYPSWLPFAIHTNIHIHVQPTRTHTHSSFTCKASIKAHPSRLAFAGTGPGCVQPSRTGHCWDSSQPRWAARFEDDRAVEFCSQISLAPPAGYIKQSGGMDWLTDPTKQQVEETIKSMKSPWDVCVCVYVGVVH